MVKHASVEHVWLEFLYVVLLVRVEHMWLELLYIVLVVCVEHVLCILASNVERSAKH